jgi:adenine-specific DNA-methyltransferase
VWHELADRAARYCRLVIKYLGSKRRLVPLIQQIVSELPVATACALFAGTTRVGQGLRQIGVEVVSNDLASYSQVLGQAYIVADEAVDRDGLRRVLAELARLPPAPGYFTQTFCVDARFFTPRNGARVDAIRTAIDRRSLGEVERGLVLTSLLEAADRVDSTTGVQMAFLKSWAPRAHNDLELREPEPVPGPRGSVVRSDANALAPTLAVDLVYIDPPYNQHSYFSNYHIWETLVRWDQPEAYGIARKRIDCQTTKSAYNSRREAPAALAELLQTVSAPWLLVSLSNEARHDRADVVAALEAHGHVGVVAVDSKRYVGAQIGIHNPAGQRVGAVSHLRNSELLFLVGPDRALVDRALSRAPQPAPA